MKNHKLQTDYKFSAKGGSASGGKIFLTSFLLATILFLPVFVFAEYTFLEPLPGLQKTIQTGEFSVYLTALFNYAIAVAAVLAVIMIVIGGLQYIGAAGNTSVIEDAKDRIYWAIVGLILALGSWMILYNINPELKELKLEGVETQTIPTPKPINCRDISPNNCDSYPNCQLFLTGAGTICGQKTGISTNKKCEDYGTPDCPCPKAETETACNNYKGCKWQSLMGVYYCGALYKYEP